MFIAEDQAPVEHQDPVGLLDDPSFGLEHEALVGEVAFNDVHWFDQRPLSVVKSLGHAIT